MKTKGQHVTCNGNHLESTLDAISARGGLVESIDAGVKSNAGYRVNFVERVRSGIAEEVRARTSKKATPLALTGSTPATAPIFPQQGKTTALLVAPRSPLNGVQIPGQTPACKPEHSNVNQSGSAETVAVDSIENRLASLQSKLAQSGKLKRSTPSHARMPYAD